MDENNQNIQQVEKLTILCVDDELTTQTIIKSTLKGQFNIITASDGEEALHLMGIHEVDLILLDIIMPKLNGHEVIKILRNIPQFNAIPVIFFTSRNTPEDLKTSLEFGANDYITKPVNPSELIARINTQLSIVKSQKTKVEYEKINLINYMISKCQEKLTGPLEGLVNGINELKSMDIIQDKDFNTINSNLERIENVISKIKKLNRVDFMPYTSDSKSSMLNISNSTNKQKV